MDKPKKGKTRRSYDVDFKQEVIKMLTSGRSDKDILDAFGIAEKRYAVAASLSLEKNGNKKDKIEFWRKIATISQQS